MLFKMKNPTDQESAEVYKVIEDRGDRVLVEEIAVCQKMAIRPTAVYLKSDITPTFSSDVNVEGARAAHIYDRATGEWICGITMPDLDLAVVVEACRELEGRGRKVTFEVVKP